MADIQQRHDLSERRACVVLGVLRSIQRHQKRRRVDEDESVQDLLKNCSSIKVKRLFLYLAEKLEHPWLDFVNLSNVDLGAGTQGLVKDSIYISKYRITVPKEFEK